MRLGRGVDSRSSRKRPRASSASVKNRSNSESSFGGGSGGFRRDRRKRRQPIEKAPFGRRPPHPRSPRRPLPRSYEPPPSPATRRAASGLRGSLLRPAPRGHDARDGPFVHHQGVGSIHVEQIGERQAIASRQAQPD